MFPDRIEIKFPGGLPKGLTEEEYENGEISFLRNPILGNVFFRLKYIEMFGTGITRIKYAYKDARIKPKFAITDHVISVILPVLSDKYNVTNDEEKVIKALENGMQLSSTEIAKITGFTKSKTLRLVEALKEKNYVRVLGKGRGTKYSL
jgi:ATP-dependent DNA helicase RecG